RPTPSLREERLAAMARVFGVEQVRRAAARYERANPDREARRWAKVTEDARTEAEALRLLTPGDAAARIQYTRAAEAQKVAARKAQQAEAERPAMQGRASGPDARGRSL
uniref:hypothetical protein n=1 Tax=Sinomonas sp. G460-2 TaxID=3393464 RepID=UPI0039EF4590